jgi:bisphosphoglycerate-independent phosphoglycerate mutase (AlkP superfamily)
MGLSRTTPSYYQVLERGMNPRAAQSPLNNKFVRATFRAATRLHFFGMCTDEGIFSHIRFLPPYFEAARLENVSHVNIHCILTTLTKKASLFVRDVERLIPPGVSARVAAVYSGETGMDKNLN